MPVRSWAKRGCRFCLRIPPRPWRPGFLRWSTSFIRWCCAALPLATSQRSCFPDGPEGRVRTNVAPIPIRSPCAKRTFQDSDAHTEKENTTTIVPMASRLALTEIAPFSCQFRIGGPKAGWFRSHPCSRGEDLANAAAATSRKGVVGRTGSTAPTRPSARNVSPRISQSARKGLSGSLRRSKHGRWGGTSPHSFLFREGPL